MDNTLFREVAPKYMRQFMADFGVTAKDAAAVFGNAGHESAGFTKLQEVAPRAGRGGWGWLQWTGPRRVAFEAYCKRTGKNKSSHDANYAWLFLELKGKEKGAVPKLKAARTLYDKVVAFERAFERAGVKHYDSRFRWAEIALDAYNNAARFVPVSSPEPDIDSWSELFAIFLRLLGALFRRRN